MIPKVVGFALRLLPLLTELRSAPYGLDCSRCPRNYQCEVWPDPELIAAWGGDIPVPKDSGIPDKWGGRCPSDWANHPEVAVASRLLAQADVSPLSNWPNGYAAWVVDAATELKAARDSIRAEALASKRRS